METQNRYRSLFWPIILIGVGIIWLLSNLGMVSLTNLVQLWRLWPLLLIVAGVDLLAGRRLPVLSALFGLLVVGLIVLFLAFPIRLPGAASAQVVTERYHLPIDQATHADVSLDFWSDPVSVRPISSTELIDAQITHVGQVNFSGSGQTEKTVQLSHTGMGFPMTFIGETANNRSDVGLTTQVPMDLTVDLASGSSNLDLTGVQLTDLNVESSSGSARITLPQSKTAYPAQIHTASGSVELTVPSGSNLDLRLSTGSGSVAVRLPADSALKIVVQDSGSGSLHIPTGLTQTASGSGDTGTWETTDYATAANKITITVTSFGSGSLNFTR